MDFKWTSSKVMCNYPSLEKGDFSFYKSFYFKKEEFKLGEFVVVKKSKTTNSKIGMLMAVYQSHESWDRNSPFRGIVSWYTIANYLNPQLQRSRKMDLKNEVIQDSDDVDTSINLEHILKKCKVIFATIGDPVYLVRANNLDKNTYYSCRYKVKAGKLVPIFSSDTENYIVNGKLSILPDFDHLDTDVIDLSDETVLPEFVSVNNLTPLKSIPIKYDDYKRRRDSVDLDESDVEVEVEKIKSLNNPQKNLRLTPKSDKRADKHKKSPIKRSSSVRRVLNDSFESSFSLKTPTQTYEIVDSNCDSKNRIKIKLKLNDGKFKATPKVIPTALDNSITDLKSVNVNDLKEVDNKIVLRSKEKTTPTNGCNSPVQADAIRRSTRNKSRKSYAEFISPQYETPKKRSWSNNVATHCSRVTRSRSIYENRTTDDIKSTPDINVRTPQISDLEKISEQAIAPKPNTPNGKRKAITVSEPTTPKVTKPNLRKSVLKSTSKKIIHEDEDTPLQDLKTSKLTATPSPKSLKCTPTAKARMVREGVITPSVQSRNKAVENDGTPLAKARSQLHVSYVPNALPCRETEFSNIFNFLEGKLEDGCGGCMYVSGVPGTGKTATVTEVIRNLQESAKNNEIPDFKYVNINGMRLSEPRQSYVEIVKQLMGKTLPWEQAQTTLENKFVKLKKKTTPIILVVDELDILCTKRQDVVYNLLDWPTKANTQLIVVTIANTMDLPERLLMGRVTSRLGLTRLTFQAYTHKQLQEIVMKRLTGTNAFNPDAVQLVARKVASVSGDARRALDICRRSAEIAELEADDTLVSMTHVNQALSAMITQPKVQAIKRSSKLEKLVLQAVVAEVERTGVEETTFINVFTMLVSLAALEGFKMVSNTIVMGVIAKLGACRLLLTDQKCNNIYQRIILNVSTDDVYYALTKADL